jgi:hypothetical protein
MLSPQGVATHVSSEGLGGTLVRAR